MIENSFVRKVVRIIRRELRLCNSGERAIVLVSKRFYEEATEELERMAVRSSGNQLFIIRRHVFPVRWLSDYEFEIR